MSCKGSARLLALQQTSPRVQMAVGAHAAATRWCNFKNGAGMIVADDDVIMGWRTMMSS